MEKDYEQREHQFSPQEIVRVLRTLKKDNRLFKPLKKLKHALEKTKPQNIAKRATRTIIVYHFGLGNQKDHQFLRKTNFIDFQCTSANPIIPGKAYSFLTFPNQQCSQKYITQYDKLIENRCWFISLEYIGIEKILIAMFWEGEPEELDNYQTIENCSSKFEKDFIPGLIIQKDFLSSQQSQLVVNQIDANPWVRLNNRRVQHYGYEFKYGQNGIDKENGKTHQMPQWVRGILDRFQHNYPQIYKLNQGDFDQLTVNDYFAGDGIPAHFDTHSPFQEHFIAISLLSGIVMNLRRFDGRQESVYLSPNSMMMFSGQARFAWTHAIQCRKVDKVDNQVSHRSRRISLTFRKIKKNPCDCKYYFYCDSQGYDQSTMKKNNWLLQKYMHQLRGAILQTTSPEQIERQFVYKAYNGFGYNFQNQIIPAIRVLLEKQTCSGDFILDVGCGNSAYRPLIHPDSQYFGVQFIDQFREKCEAMRGEEYENRMLMDCTEIGFRSEIFDMVLLIAVLHHLGSVNRRVRCIKQCYRLLRKGGILYLTVFSYSKKQHIYCNQDIFLDYCLPSHKVKLQKESPQKQVGVHESRGEVFTRYYHLFKVDELQEILKSIGFIIIELIEDEENIIVKAQKI